MKIVFFTNEYAHAKLPASGGVGSFLKVMSEALVKKGHEIHIYGFSKRSIEFQDKGIYFSFFKKYSKQFRFREFVRSASSKMNIKGAELSFLKQERQFLAKQLKTYCKSHNIDIIESFVFNGFSAYWDNSTPLVIRFHGSRGFWHQYLGAEKDEHKIAMEKKALLATPYSVVNSHFSKKFIKDYYNVDVDIVIHNGINTLNFAPDKSVKEIPKSIYYIGTLSEAKGVKDLVAIFNDVVLKEPEATLHLIGRGETYWNYLKLEVCSKNALKQTTYYNHVQLSEIPKKLSEASIIAVPSKGETFGFTIVEAMALEKVVIVSNIPVAEELITNGEDGFIAKDTTDFKNSILNVFENPEAYKKLRQQAREKVVDNFTQEKMIDATLKYYKKILNT